MQGQMRPGSLNAASSAAIARGDIRLGTAGPNKSRYRGVSYDKKKRKWRVQIKVRADVVHNILVDTDISLAVWSFTHCCAFRIHTTYSV